MSEPDDELREVLERSKQLGFLGPGDIDAHLHHASGFVELVSTGSVLDLGSGGGLPGLILARRCPALDLTLLDSNERRVAFLRGAVRALGYAHRVDVVLGRAERLAWQEGLREQFDAVTARSFGAPAVTGECAVGFLKRGGRLLVSEPPTSPDRWPREQLALIGLAPGRSFSFATATIRELIRLDTPIDGVPRAVGVPARHPLF